MIVVVEAAVNTTIDVVCLCFAVVSLAVPWRFPFALMQICGANSRSDFRERSCLEFSHSFIDCVAAPFGIAALVCPWRFPFIFASYYKCVVESSEVYSFELRFLFIVQFFLSLREFFLVFLFAFSFVRWPSLCRRLLKHREFDATMYVHSEWTEILLEEAVLAFADMLYIPVLALVS